MAPSGYAFGVSTGGLPLWRPGTAAGGVGRSGSGGGVRAFPGTQRRPRTTPHCPSPSPCWPPPVVAALAGPPSQPSASSSRTAKTKPREPIVDQLWELASSRSFRAGRLGLALCTALSLSRCYLVEPRLIPSSSMAPTLAVGDMLVIAKTAPVVRGAIVTFRPPPLAMVGHIRTSPAGSGLASADDGGGGGGVGAARSGSATAEVWIKRVVAVAEDEVHVSGGVLYVNGTAVDGRCGGAYEAWEGGVVPRGHLAVLGDNRGNSNDSHCWGWVPAERVAGVAVARFWPPDRLGGL